MGRLLHFRRRGQRPEPARRRSDARPDSLFPTDARLAEEPAAGAAPDPSVERRRRVRRNLVVCLVLAVFVAGSVGAIFGGRGYLDLRRSREELAALQRDVDAEQARVDDLWRQVERLKTRPEVVERIAREQLGYVKDGEVNFLLPRKADRGPGARLYLPPKAVKKAKTAGEAPRD